MNIALTNDADYHRKVWKLSVKIHLIAGISRVLHPGFDS